MVAHKANELVNHGTLAIRDRSSGVARSGATKRLDIDRAKAIPISALPDREY